MSAIAGIVKGNGIRGILNYDLKKAGARIVAGNLIGTTTRGLAREFGTVRSLRPDLNRPVRHPWLSFSEDDRHRFDADPSLSGKIARRWMEEVVFAVAPPNDDGTPGECPFIVVEHPLHDPKKDKRRNPATAKLNLHIPHLAITWAGKRIPDSHDYHRSFQAMREIEKEFGLSPLELREDRTKLSRSEIEMERSQGTESTRRTIHEAIKAALEAKPASLEAFCTALQKKGIGTSFNLQGTGRLAGASFSFGELNFKASQIAKNCSWPHLMKQISYDEIRDLDAVRQRAATATATTRDSACVEHEHTAADAGATAQPNPQEPRSLGSEDQPALGDDAGESAGSARRHGTSGADHGRSGNPAETGGRSEPSIRRDPIFDRGHGHAPAPGAATSAGKANEPDSDRTGNCPAGDGVADRGNSSNRSPTPARASHGIVSARATEPPAAIHHERTSSARGEVGTNGLGARVETLGENVDSVGVDQRIDHRVDKLDAHPTVRPQSETDGGANPPNPGAHHRPSHEEPAAEQPQGDLRYGEIFAAAARHLATLGGELAELWFFDPKTSVWQMLEEVVGSITNELLARLQRMQVLGWEVRVRAVGSTGERALLAGFGGQVPQTRPVPAMLIGISATPMTADPVMPKAPASRTDRRDRDALGEADPSP